MENGFRPPNEFEKSILQLLLSVNFKQVEQLRTQLANLMVRSLDEDFCVELKVSSGEPAPQATGIPVEGNYVTDGDWNAFIAKTHILLHVDANGFMKELEFYNDDDKTITRPILEAIHIEVNEAY